MASSIGEDMRGLGTAVGSDVDWQNPDYTTPTDVTYRNVDSVYAGAPLPGTNWANIIGTAAAGFVNIWKTVKPLPSGCIQVAGPYGVSTQCGNESSQPQLGISSASAYGGALGGGSSSLLLIGGAVLIVVMMMNKK